MWSFADCNLQNTSNFQFSIVPSSAGAEDRAAIYIQELTASALTEGEQNMEAGTKLCGFQVTRVRELEELGGRLWEMEHEKTGARLCWLDRPDENKTFSIAFKAPEIDP